MSREPGLDVRCPANPTQLFFRLLIGDDGLPHAYEVACRDCRRKHDGRQVLHVYALDGLYLETRVV